MNAASKLPKVAEELASAGFHILPLRPGTKVPSLKDWQNLATDDVNTVKDHWAENPDCNVGINCGLSGLYVVDIDPKNGGEATWTELVAEHGHVDTFTVRTASGGTHYYYEMPSTPMKNTAGALGAGIDTRGLGGQVVAPGSVVAGRSYKVTNNVDVAPLPKWVSEAVQPRTEPVRTTSEGMTGSTPMVEFEGEPASAWWTTCRVLELAFELAYTPEGEGNSNAARIAFMVGQYVGAGQISRAKAEKIILDHVKSWKFRDPSDKTMLMDTINRALDAGASDPREWKHHTDLANDTTDDYAPSWGRIDLTSYTNGSYKAPDAELMPRADGICLLYPGLVHSLHGESESGKSWIMQAEMARVLKAGGSVLMVDFESDPASVVQRLRLLGVSDSDIMTNFDYRRPEMRPESALERAAWEDMLKGSYKIAVIDGVTDALGLWGAKTVDNDEVASWIRTFPKAVADRTGAAVVLIDHVSRNTDTRGRFAIGAQAKMAGLSGAAYVVDVEEPLGVGLRGVLTLRVAKDRPGQVRGNCGPARKSDRTQEAARFVLDSVGSTLEATLEAPDLMSQEFRPTNMMRAISDFVEKNPGASGKNIRDVVTGNSSMIADTIKLLVKEGYLKAEKGKRGSVIHTVVKPFVVDYELPESDLVAILNPVKEVPAV